FRSVGSAGHHEKRRGDKRPKGQLRDVLFCVGNNSGRKLRGNRYAAQFLLSSSRATLAVAYDPFFCTFLRAREASWLLKNTRSAPPCNKKMHVGDIFFQLAEVHF